MHVDYVELLIQPHVDYGELLIQPHVESMI